MRSGSEEGLLFYSVLGFAVKALTGMRGRTAVAVFPFKMSISRNQAFRKEAPNLRGRAF